MPKTTRNFISGRMDKVTDERLVANGTYIDALNIRLGSTEKSELGVISNSKGNTKLTTLKYINGIELSSEARCIGAYADSANETIYWFVHDPNFSDGQTGKLDLIVSYNTISDTLSYHIISINDGGGTNTTLNFDPQYLITGVNKVDNLIFWVQANNPPRFFNVTRNYPVPVLDIDAFTAESILVIKKPPIESPAIRTYLAGGQENFIDTRFICFAYRYRYIDNEYSAISQFSPPAFTPNAFNFSIDSYLNEGMVNLHNTVEITFNSGGPLVVGIDLLFKEAQNNTIKVIEKLNKADLGIPNDSDQTYTFNNSKIFTVLPSYEILRLYDNVPRFAVAQTLMGNRLMYGNYIEGYNMFDVNGQAVQLDYTVALIEESIGSKALSDSNSDGVYNINGAQTIPDSILNIDLGGLTFPLKAGGSISIDITLDHEAFSVYPVGTVAPTETSTNIQLFFTFNLLQDYTSAYQLALSPEFQEAIGVVGGSNGIQTVPTNYCNGTKLTDFFNCNIPNNLDSYTKFASGINATPQAIAVIAGVPNTSSTVISFQFPAMRFVDNVSAPAQNVFEFYSITFAQATYQEVANPTSLHSNRSYEIGIVYQDDYLRSTTALVSPDNTVFVPCGNSELQNSIQVTIPPNQKPPDWATRYKFVIKADVENYDTIYSSIFFNDPLTNSTYLLLEGENALKVEQGDRYIVKRDVEGALQDCAYVTILEKQSQAEGFITIPSVLNPTENIYIPAGVYAKINSNSFSTVTNDSSVIAPGTIQVTSVDSSFYCPNLAYPANTLNTTTNLYEDYTIPAGSQIKILFKFERLGGVGNCDVRKYLIDKTLISSANYNNLQDWFEGDKVDVVLNQGTYEVRGGTCIPYNEYNPNGQPYTPGTNVHNEQQFTSTLVCDPCVNHFEFQRQTSNNALYLVMNGCPPCDGSYKKDKRQSKVWATITVYRATSLLVFETEPKETLPDVFFENNLSFSITNGFHTGNVQNQTASLPAIIDTEFFNCYAFGNGVESYKIRDSITGKTFNFGNRVTSVSAQDYKEAHRFADMTYSGIYNNESNVNKLNEFNLGIANFKALENSFGSIQIMDARETDVLVLQEDKISYVLAGKNLLSDAAAGGQIASVPEVLGTQIARVEKYGISFNPESYVHWGYDRFFTDIKRGAVIQLKGASYNSDQLIVISEFGMRTYFRDLFIQTSDTQKLGGFDPYMNEYILGTNDIQIPGDTTCVKCGMRQIFTVEPYIDLDYCIDAGRGVGEVVISWAVEPVGEFFEVVASYNGTDVSSGPVSGSGSIVVNKNSQNKEIINLLIMSTGNITLTMNVACPLSEQMTVVQICLTNDADGGAFIHNEYSYVNGTYVSPTTSNLVTFANGTTNPLVSEFISFADYVGTGAVPNPSSTVRLICNKTGFDTFDFDPTKNKFMYLASDVQYNNNQADITALLAAANTATPNQGSGANQYAQFVMPGAKDYLYLIWDYRAASPVELCFGPEVSDACCDCDPCTSDCSEYFISNASSGTIVSYKDCYTGLIDQIDIAPYTGIFLCSRTDFVPVVDLGSAQIKTVSACGCDTCAGVYGGCAYFEVEVLFAGDIEYTPCGSTTPITVSFETGIYNFCTSGESPIGVSGVISINFVQCGCP